MCDLHFIESSPKFMFYELNDTWNTLLEIFFFHYPILSDNLDQVIILPNSEISVCTSLQEKQSTSIGLY